MTTQEEGASTELTTQTTGTAVGAVITDYSDFGVTGFENQTREDIKIPFIRLLQPTSPAAVDGTNGARPGFWFNSVTKQVYETFDFIACATKHVFVEWEPRDDKGNLPADAVNGGFLGTHEPTSDLVKTARAASIEFGVYLTPEGKELVETFYVFGIAIDPKTGDEIEAMVAYASTGIAAYKSWNSMANTQMYVNKRTGRKEPLPLFTHVFRWTSEKVQKGGNTWFKPAFAYSKGTAAESRLLPADPLVIRGADIAKAVIGGTANIDLSQATNDRASGGGATGADKDIPF